MLALAGQLEPIAGSVFLEGHPAPSDEARGLRNVVTSRPALIPSLTLRDHVELAHISLGLPRERIERRLEDYQLSAWIDAPLFRALLGKSAALLVGPFDRRASTHLVG